MDRPAVPGENVMRLEMRDDRVAVTHRPVTIDDIRKLAARRSPP